MGSTYLCEAIDSLDMARRYYYGIRWSIEYA